MKWYSIGTKMYEDESEQFCIAHHQAISCLDKTCWKVIKYGQEMKTVGHTSTLVEAKALAASLA